MIFITLLIEFCSCSLDQNRWQPYEYQYFIILFFLYCYRKNAKQFINYFAFLIIVIYFFSGLHKFSGSFLYTVWENLILLHFFGLDHKTIDNIFIHYGGLALPLIEFGAAIGLLLSKQKKIFAGLLIAMHLFILMLLSPLGINYNPIIWPWNIAMILFLCILYFKDSPVNIAVPDVLKGFHKVHLLYLVVLPSVSFLGYYDHYLSFNLYSGGLKSMEICIKNERKAAAYQPFFFDSSRFCEGEKSIDINQWALKEMNIIPYPEERNLMGIIKKFKSRNPEIDATFIVYKYPYKLQDREIYK